MNRGGSSQTLLHRCDENSLAYSYDADGRAEKPILYDGYGMLVWPDEPSSQRMRRQPFQYKGQAGYYGDAHTGLYYCHNRYYDPRLGSWLSRDPIGLEGGINLYSYCGGNPVMFWDPSGLDWDWGQYWSDVGGVFRGYGKAARGVITSPISTAEFLQAWSGNGWSAEFGKRAAYDTWVQFYGGLKGERGAEGFGESFGQVLIAGGSSGAGGILSKAPKAKPTHLVTANRTKGLATQATVAAATNTKSIRSLSGTAKFRKPDILDAKTIGDVKDVGYLSLTSQLRDYILHAKAYDKDFVLYVRSGAKLSGPLAKALGNAKPVRVGNLDYYRVRF